MKNESEFESSGLCVFMKIKWFNSYVTRIRVKNFAQLGKLELVDV